MPAPRSIWRYAELLPVETIPTEGLRVGLSPLVPTPRLAAALGLERAVGQGRLPQPHAVVQGPGRRLRRGSRQVSSASPRSPAPAPATSRRRSPRRPLAIGLDAVVFIPADLEAVKVAQAQALGATVVRVDGPYDAVNRLCLELTGEQEDWAVVNVNLRPFYAEGSKTLAYEIAQQLGWRTPDVVVAPLASGSLYTKLGRAFGELVQVGLIDEAPIRYIGGQAAGCGPIAAAWADGADVVTPVERPDTIVRSLAIGSPADGPYALKLARRSGGSIHGCQRCRDARFDPPARPHGGHPDRDRRWRDARGAAARDRRRQRRP